MSEIEKPNAEFKEIADIETSSADYAQRFAGKIGEYLLDVQTRITMDLLSPWPRARVLEIGGGHAQNAVPLVKHGFDVTVTGSSEVCRERLDKFLDSGSYEFIVCDMLETPFDDNSFDIVIAYRLLPHVDQWQRLIKEMTRLAKFAVIVDYPDIRSFNLISEKLFKFKKKIEGNTRPFKCFSRNEILLEFKKNEFTKPVIRPEFFIPMVIHRFVGNVLFSKSLELLSRVLCFTYFFGSPVIVRLSAIK